MTDAHVLLGDVDHELLVRLQPLAVGTEPGDDPRPRHLELVALAPHRLHQDAEVELAASRDGVGVGAVGLLDPERHVALQLPEQPVPDLAAGDVLPVPAGERAVVDDEVHRDRRLLDRDAQQPLRVRPPTVKVLPISIALEAGRARTMSPASASFTSTRFRPSKVNSLVIRLRSNASSGTRPGSPSGSSATWSPTCTRPALDPPDRRCGPRKVEKSSVEISIWNGPVGIARRRRHVVENRLEQRLQIGARVLQLAVAVPARLDV